MTRIRFLALVGSTALASAAAWIPTASAQQPAGQDDCALLLTYVEKPAAPLQGPAVVTVDQVREFQRANNLQACREAIQRLAQAGHDVRRAQAQPGQTPAGGTAQVQVRTQPPEVTVRQPMPEILVRQPAPNITVELPQPEIVVRMPQPEVNVATAPPQVEVRQPQPQVQVVRPGQQAEVQVQREGQPQVRYEQVGQANIQYRRAEGQPQIRYEQAAAQDAGRDQTRAAETTQTRGTQTTTTETTQTRTTQTARLSDEQRRSIRERLAVGQERDAVRTAQTQTRAISYSELERMNVYNFRGDRIGEVEQVLKDPNSDRYQIVIGAGGFLGIGETHVAFPADRFWIRGDRLYLRGVTEDDIEAMGNYRDQAQGWRRVTGKDQGVYIAVWPS